MVLPNAGEVMRDDGSRSTKQRCRSKRVHHGLNAFKAKGPCKRGIGDQHGNDQECSRSEQGLPQYPPCLCQPAFPIMLTAGSNASGFSATGNGYRSDSGAWGNTYTVFWTSDDASNNSGAITRKLLGTDNGVTAVLDPKKWGAAVRCIKEDTE